jgi:Mn-dependent DtxR family transcriptional regulator
MKQTEQKISTLNMDYSKITNLLFSKVFLDTLTIEKELKISNRTVLRYIAKLEENNVVKSVKI